MEANACMRALKRVNVWESRKPSRYKWLQEGQEQRLPGDALLLFLHAAFSSDDGRGAAVTLRRNSSMRVCAQTPKKGLSSGSRKRFLDEGEGGLHRAREA